MYFFLFQFLIGSVKSDTSTSDSLIGWSFQFLIGSVKRESAPGVIFTAI